MNCDIAGKRPSNVCMQTFFYSKRWRRARFHLCLKIHQVVAKVLNTKLQAVLRWENAKKRQYIISGQ